MQNSCKTNKSSFSCKEPMPHSKHIYMRESQGETVQMGRYTEGSPGGDEGSVYSESGPSTNSKLLDKT